MATVFEGEKNKTNKTNFAYELRRTLIILISFEPTLNHGEIGFLGDSYLNNMPIPRKESKDAFSIYAFHEKEIL